MALMTALELQTLMARAGSLRQGIGALWSTCPTSMDMLTHATGPISEPSTSRCPPSHHRLGNSWQDFSQLQCSRGYAKGKPSKPAAKQAAPAAAEPAQPVDSKTDSPLRLLNKRFGYKVQPTSLLTPQELEVAQAQLMPPPPTAGSGADAAAQPAELVSFKQLGVPVSPRDVVQLMHTSMSRTVGENVHLRHFVYNSLFQSAAGVAQYVAAGLEAGTAWPRIERFFLSCVEDDRSLVAAIKIQVRGRFGRKAGMAGRKIWEQGSLKPGELSCPVDYGAAHAFTRVGMLGVKVWIRYKPGVAAAGMMQRHPPAPTTPLLQVLATLRTSPPVSAACTSAGWWSTPGPGQPLVNSTWRAFVPDYNPVTESVTGYLDKHKPLLFRNDMERVAYLKSQQPEQAAPGANATSLQA